MTAEGTGVTEGGQAGGIRRSCESRNLAAEGSGGTGHKGGIGTRFLLPQE